MTVCIRSVSSYLPNKIITNHDLALSVDTSDEWIFSRTGIRQRHIVSEDESVQTMALNVANSLVDTHLIDKDEIGVLIVATSTVGKVIPSVASWLQDQMGCRNVDAFDLNAACSGFVCALNVAEKLLRFSDKKYAMVIGSEVTSSVVDWKDRSTAILFGDGAGGVLIEKSDQAVFESATISENHFNILNNYMSPQGFLCMDGKNVFKLAVECGTRMIDELLQKIPSDFFDMIVPHQANSRIIDALKSRYPFPCEWVSSIDRYANTSAASIPIALSDYFRNKEPRCDQWILLIGFGAGFKVDGCIIKVSSHLRRL